MPLLALLAALVATAPLQRTVATRDGSRGYLLLKPAAKGPLPLVILLHGRGGSAMQALTEGPLAAWKDISARAGVLVAALAGLRGSDGKQEGNDCRGAAVLPTADDVAFAAAAIDDLIRRDGADARRVYVMGMSNGAVMTLRLALELTPAPAAIAAVCGLLADGGHCAMRPRPVPALVIAGTDDPLVPWAGGKMGTARKDRGAVRSAEATAAFFVAANGLSGT